eukprot:2115311-Amphidinium_carterae.1
MDSPLFVVSATTGLNAEHMQFLEKHNCKVEVVAQWIQQLSVQALRSGAHAWHTTTCFAEKPHVPGRSLGMLIKNA